MLNWLSEKFWKCMGRNELQIPAQDCLAKDPQGSLTHVKAFYTSCLSISKAQQAQVQTVRKHIYSGKPLFLVSNYVFMPGCWCHKESML